MKFCGPIFIRQTLFITFYYVICSMLWLTAAVVIGMCSARILEVEMLLKNGMLLDSLCLTVIARLCVYRKRKERL